MNVIDRDEVLREIKQYFDIEELVCNLTLQTTFLSAGVRMRGNFLTRYSLPTSYDFVET